MNKYQSVNGEDGFRVVEYVAQSTSFSIHQFQSESLLETSVKCFLTVNSDGIRRLVVNGAVRGSRRFTYGIIYIF